MNQQWNIVILGGGISGLALAYFLKKSLPTSTRICVFEANARVGGWIESKYQHGYLFEQGPRSCRSFAAAETLTLAEHLNIFDKIIFANKEASARFLYINNQLSPLPNSLFALCATSFGRQLLRGIVHDVFAKKIDVDMSIDEFFRQRFSPFFADVCADALTSGIYAGNTRMLSIKSCFPKLFQWQYQRGSVTLGALTQRGSLTKTKRQKLLSPLFSFTQGMQTLVDTLSHELANNIYTNVCAQKIRFQSNKLVVETSWGTHAADQVFSCLPAHRLAEIVDDTNAFSATLNNIKSASVAAVNFGFTRDVCHKNGFGYLIPRKEQQENLGVVWDSKVFPTLCKKGQSVVTVMIGKEHFLPFDQCSEEDFVHIARRCVQKQMNIADNPAAINVSIAHNAIPQYAVGHSQLVQEIERQCSLFSPRLTVLGSSFYGVSVNDCIKKAHEVALAYGAQENARTSSNNA